MKIYAVLLRILSVVLLIFMWTDVLVHFDELPERMAVNFDFFGKPGAMGSRHALWVFLFVGTGLFSLLQYLSKHPTSALLNLPDNIRKKPVLTEFIVSLMMFLVMTLFVVIEFGSIRHALGAMNGLGNLPNYILLFILVILGGVIGYSASSDHQEPSIK